MASDVLDDNAIDEVRKILRLPEGGRFTAFAEELRAYANKMRRAVEATPSPFKNSPFDKSLTKRADWLATKIVRPTERILAALDDDNRPYLALWPDEALFKEPVDYDAITEHLNALHDRASNLRESLIAQAGEGLPHAHELRTDIVYRTIELFWFHYPEEKISRGTPDKESRRMIGAVPEFARFCFEKITGNREQLDDLIRTVHNDIKAQKRQR